MNKIANVLISGLFVVGMLASVSALADDHRCRDGFAGGHSRGFSHQGIEKLVDKLDLSDEQAAEIKAIREQAKSERLDRKDAMADRYEHRRELMDAVHNGASEREVRKLVEQQNEQRLEQILARAEVHQQMLAVLNDEQRVELEELREKRLEKMDRKMKKRLKSHS